MALTRSEAVLQQDGVAMQVQKKQPRVACAQQVAVGILQGRAAHDQAGLIVPCSGDARLQAQQPGQAVSIVWQMLPYVALTLGEVLVSATGLEFAYSQAPLSMKGTITSFWNLSVTIGNLWVLLSNVSIKSPGALQAIKSSGYSETACLMFFFAGFALVAAALFGLVARRYPLQDNYRG